MSPSLTNRADAVQHLGGIADLYLVAQPADPCALRRFGTRIIGGKEQSDPPFPWLRTAASSIAI